MDGTLRRRSRAESLWLILPALLAVCAYLFTGFEPGDGAGATWPVASLPQMILLAAALAMVLGFVDRARRTRFSMLAAIAIATQMLLLALLMAMAGFVPPREPMPTWLAWVLPATLVAVAVAALRVFGDRELTGGSSRFTPPALTAASIGAALLMVHSALAAPGAGDTAWHYPISAAALALASGGLLLAILGHRRAAIVVIALAAPIAVGILAHSAAHRAAGSDPHVATLIALPSNLRIALGTSVSALLVVLGTIALLGAHRRRAWLAATWFAGVFAGMLGVIDIADFVANAPILPTGDRGAWPATVAAFAVTSAAFAMMTAGLGDRHDLSRRGLWRAIGIAVASLLLSIWLWRSLDAQRDAVAQRGLASAEAALASALDHYSDVRLSSFERLAARLQLLDADSAARIFRNDARSLLTAVPGARAVSWREADGTPIVPAVAIDSPGDAIAASSDDAHRRAAIEAIRLQRRWSAPARADAGGTALTLAFPGPARADAPRRAIVVDIESSPFLDAMLATTAPGYDLAVSDGDARLFTRAVDGLVAGTTAPVTGCTAVFGRQWCWQIRQTRAALPSLGDDLPEIVLFGSLATGALLALALRLAVLSRARARSAERAAAAIAAESRAREQAQRELLESRRFAEHVLHSIADGFVSVDRKLRFEYVNPRAEVLLQRPAHALIGQCVTTLFPELTRGEGAGARLRRLARGETETFEQYFATIGRWLAIRAYPRDDGITVYFQDVSEQRQSRRIELRQRALIEGIAAGRVVDDTLRDVVLMFEDQFPDAIASVLRYDAANQCVRAGAAPRLPEVYNAAIDGAAVGPCAGSCGTAIWRRERVVVTDIATDPLWADFRALALPLGLRACWSQPLFDAQGQVIGTFAVYYRTPREPIAREIEVLGACAAVAAVALERAQVLHKIATSEQRFRSLFDYHPDAVFALDARGRVVECNDACVRMARRERAMMIGESTGRIVPAELRRTIARCFLMALRGQAQYFAAAGATGGGDVIPLDVTLLPIVVDGAIVGIFGIARDTSERERTLRLLAERDRFFELSAELFCIVTPDGRFRQVNDAFQRVLGYESQALIGTVVRDLVITEDRAAADEAAARLRRDGDLSSHLARARCADGTHRWVETNARLGPDRTIYAVMRDVDDRKRMDAELARVLAELESSNKDLQDFAFVASHDLQEPLRKIQVFGDRLRANARETLGEQGADYLERMIGAATRMQGLIDDLLAYSRVTTRGQPFEAVDLGQVARDVLLDLEARIEATGARVEVSNLPRVAGDPTQMRQLLQNLIANAVKFHPPGRKPEVTVDAYVATAEDGRDWCVLTVADNGIGFDNQYRERIFQPFQRLQGRSAYEGTGMGLAIVRKIVERHGGQIDAEGTVDVGARFTVHLPLVQSPSNGAAAPP